MLPKQSVLFIQDRKMIAPLVKAEGESYFATCERDEGGQCLPSGEGGKEPATKKPAKKESSKKKKPPKKFDEMQGHPFAGKNKDEIKKELVGMYPGGMGGMVVPKEFQLRNPDMANEAKVADDIENNVREVIKKNSFAVPSIKETYDSIKQHNPDVSLQEFQMLLGKMHREGRLRLTAYTQSVGEMKYPEYILPLDGDFRFYLHLGNKAKKEVATEPAKEPAKEPVKKTGPVELTEADLLPEYVGQPIEETDKPPEHLKKSSASLISSLNSKQQRALSEYTGMGYETLNKSMRSCPPNFECVMGTDKKMMDDIEEALDKAPAFSEPVAVYRGLTAPASVIDELLNIVEKQQKSGDSFMLPSLTSTSINPSQAGVFAKNVKADEKAVMFRIKANKGLYLSSIADNESEREVLLSSKSNYKVIAVEDTDFVKTGQPNASRKVIYLEQVG